VPLSLLFSRLRLPLRDAAMRVSKQARLVVQDEGVSLDKAISDALFPALLHLVRNAVAHGIESPVARREAGKEESGLLSLHARNDRGQVVIEIRDDGAGLQLQKLRQRGIAAGLVEEEVGEAVFAPGLSTDETASDVSGRGRGCEIVKQVVERLGGSIAVDSTPGAGTSFVLTLPISMAIGSGLVVRSGNSAFAFPLHFAEHLIPVDEQEIVESAGERRVRVGATLVPVKSMAALLGQPVPATPGPLIVLRPGADRFALSFDAVVGQEELVVKPLGPPLAGHPLFAGVCLRGSGEMVLVVDVPGMAQALRGKPGVMVIRGVPGPAKPPPVRSPVRLVPPVARAKRVLFVDDSLSVRKVAQQVLTGLGVEVVLAVDGLDALAQLRETTVDLVFTDLEMPRMHGFELIRELRVLAAYKELPIVVVSSRVGNKHQEQAKALGATAYLAKPFTARSLDAMLALYVRPDGRGQG
jgi:chemosensory pili system protein ChpA (sensor histidine kinase/response regulator)